MLSKTHEGTFGGPLLRDRLWFFARRPLRDGSTRRTRSRRAAPAYTRTDTNRRGEVKLTATVGAGQTIQGSFIDNSTQQATLRRCRRRAARPGALLTRSRAAEPPVRRQLQRRWSARSSSPRCSTRRSGRASATTAAPAPTSSTRRSGRSARTPVSRAVCFYNGPYLDATDPEHRNNRQFTGSVVVPAVEPGLGSHELKGGAEYFVSTGDRRQLAVVDRLRVRHRLPDGRRRVVRDAAGAPVPVFTPDVSQVWNVPGDARRRGQHQDDLALPAGSLDRVAAPDARPRHPVRDGAQRRDGRHHDGRHHVDRAAARAPATTLQGDGQTVLYAHLRSLLGQVRPGAVRGEHQRRPAERSRLRLHRTGGRRARLRARLRSGQLHARGLRELPDRQRAGGRRHPLAADAGVHARPRPRARRARPRQGDLRVAHGVELRRGLRRPDHRRDDGAAGRYADATASTTTPTRSDRDYQAVDAPERLPRCATT